MPRNNSYNKKEYKLKQSKSHLGKLNGMYGVKRDSEFFNKIWCTYYHSDKFKTRQLNKIQNFLLNSKRKEDNRIMLMYRNMVNLFDKQARKHLPRVSKGKKHWWKPHSMPHTVETRHRQSISHSKLWRNKVFAARRILENMNTSSPTSFENLILSFCKCNNMNFEFVGNGVHLIGYKSPDFIDYKKKKIIEVYYSFFKIKSGYKSSEEYEDRRYKHFQKYGYETLFIDEVDIKTGGYRQKIIEFNK